MSERSATPWHFYLEDRDRSTGWTNHGHVLQFVATGFGDTPEEAWAMAVDCEHVPEGFDLTEPCKLVAIKALDEKRVQHA